jgi:transcriptional regulator with XRE-family HTH domain
MSVRNFSERLGGRFRAAFGERLRALREDVGMPQKELAARVRTRPATIGRYESGENFPKVEMLLRLRKELNVSLDSLVTGQTGGSVRDVRLLARLQRLDLLPSDKIVELVRLLDAFLESHAPRGGFEATGRAQQGGR